MPVVEDVLASNEVQFLRDGSILLRPLPPGPLGNSSNVELTALVETEARSLVHGLLPVAETHLGSGVVHAHRLEGTAGKADAAVSDRAVFQPGAALVPLLHE